MELALINHDLEDINEILALSREAAHYPNHSNVILLISLLWYQSFWIHMNIHNNLIETYLTDWKSLNH
jgi:hypothetical protein